MILTLLEGIDHDYMMYNCPKTCKFCIEKPKLPGDAVDDADDDNDDDDDDDNDGGGGGRGTGVSEL